MDHFVNSVESQKYVCRRFDMLTSHITVRFLFFYANNTGAEDFMPGDKLEEGFYRTLVLCPWFAGDIKQTKGCGMEVIVDKGSLNMPEYRESQSLVHFSKIQSSGFNRATWPDDLVPVGPVPRPDKATGKIKLLHVHIARLKDNSGLAISVNFNHGVADGTTVMIFLNRWADETRALVTGIPVAATTFCFGADILRKHLPSERAPLSEASCEVSSARSRMADFILWLSPNKRAGLVNYLTNAASPRGHQFRIPRAKIDGLRSQVLEHLPHGARLSTNDVISAVLHRVHEQSVIRKSQGWLTKLTNRKSQVAGEHCSSVNIEYRRHLGMTEMNYMGNPVLSDFILTPMHQAHLPITAKTISVVAAQIRSLISALTIPRIGQAVDIFEPDAPYATNFFAIGKSYKLVTATTNTVALKMYAADFGNGVQAYSATHPEIGMGVFVVLPSPPPSSDILVNICDASSVMDSFMKNEFWSDFAELVY